MEILIDGKSSTGTWRNLATVIRKQTRGNLIRGAKLWTSPRQAMSCQRLPDHHLFSLACIVCSNPKSRWPRKASLAFLCSPKVGVGIFALPHLFLLHFHDTSPNSSLILISTPSSNMGRNIRAPSDHGYH